MLPFGNTLLFELLLIGFKSAAPNFDSPGAYPFPGKFVNTQP